MAVRLARWSSRSTPEPTSLADHAAAYVAELAFVDWAREAICRGENEPVLSSAYQQLEEAVARRRATFDERFGRILADWTEQNAALDGVCGVEDVLDQVVGKVLACGHPILLLVMDGMSWAVCYELLTDLRLDHWGTRTLDGSTAPPAPVLAMVPSVTSCSRASLLSGQRLQGGQDLERKHFEQNAALTKHCDKKHPPVLFHKGDLTQGPRGPLALAVEKQLLDPKRKVVGVVLNAVDERLATASQIRDEWTVNRLPPLASLLRLARDTDRVVIVVSDHGHVLHRGERQPGASTEVGNRWRSAEGSPSEREVLLQGERVLVERKAAILPWSEEGHYAGPHHGYHGGASPQEMLCPLLILQDKSAKPKGLFETDYPEPEWWRPAPTPSVESTPRVTPKAERKTLLDLLPQEGASPAAEAKAPLPDAAWIDELLASSVYAAQKAMIRRHPPSDEEVRTCLAVLAARGGILTPAAFTREAKYPSARLDGHMAKLQRLLNVDGYEILIFRREENRVELDLAKLKRQFGLE